MKQIVKISSVLLILIAVCALFAGCAKKETNENGVVLTLDKDTNTYTVVGYTGSSTEVVIPDKFNGLLVTAIGESAFGGNTTVTSVKIPNTIKSIGSIAFNGCTALSQVEFIGFDGNSALTELPTGVFNGCSALKSLEMPDSITRIGYKAFAGCTAMTELSLSDKLGEISNYAFMGCGNLSNVLIKSSFTVYANAFSGCASLKTLATPEAATDEEKKEESKKVYKYNHSAGLLTDVNGTRLIKFLQPTITKFEIPAVITEIEAGAFMEQTNLTEITVDPANTVFNYEDGILYRENMLVAYPAGKSGSSFTIPERITEIGSYAFSGNDELTDIVLSANVTSIGAHAFRNCGLLTTFISGTGNIKIGGGAFYGCPLASYKINKDSVEEYKLSGRVLLSADGTKIVSYAKELTETVYEIPAGILAIEPGAFSVNSKLNEFKSAEGNTVFTTDSGVLYSKDANGAITTLCAYPSAKTNAEYSVISTVTSIMAYAFKGNESLQKVSVPAGVEKLDIHVFENCKQLSELTLLSTKLDIQSDAFTGCTNLKTLRFAGNKATLVQALNNSGSGNAVLKENVDSPTGLTLISDYTNS